MTKFKFLIVMAFTLVLSPAGYTADPEQQGAAGCEHGMGMARKSGEMTGGMHHGAMMQHGMTSQHNMQSGVSPVTIMIQPGMNPMMSHDLQRQGSWGGHKYHGKGQDKTNRRHEKHQRESERKAHMDRIEKRLENIEALLGELVELQKNG